MALQNTEQEVTIHGTLQAVSCDDNGNIDCVAVITPNDETVSVQNDKRGSQLVDFMGKEVELTGIIQSNPHGDRIICVRTFEIFDDDDDEEEWDDEGDEEDDLDDDENEDDDFDEEDV